MSKLSQNSVVQQFVPKEIFTVWGEKASQFVSDNIVKLYEFLFTFFNTYYKNLDSNVERVEIVVNNWHDANLIKILGKVFNWRGLRTVTYILEQINKGIKTAKLSQHVGGSTNAIDFNVIIYFKGGKHLVVNSNDVYDIIVKHEKQFMEAGLTTLENKTMTQGWTHGDCRYTGQQTLYIVNP